MRRTAACNWVEACGLPAGSSERWSKPPVVFRSHLVRLATGTKAPSDAAERAAFEVLSTISQALLKERYAPSCGLAVLKDPSLLELIKLASS